MKKALSSIYGLVAYISLFIGTVFSALWVSPQGNAMHAAALCVALVCAVVGLASITMGMKAEQRFIDRG